jgi:symplekin
LPYVDAFTQVIQAIKTYKTLIPYVAGGLMTRLIQKKIWTIGKLWDGFVLCGKIIAPASYPSLLLLPATQLAEVAEKHSALRVGLREYVLKKGGNTSRYLDVLGREETNVPAQAS